MSRAAYVALNDLFPSDGSVFDALMSELGFDPGDASVDPATAAGVANVVCTAILESRHADGANQMGDLTPSGVPYADYSDYVPVNTASVLADPNHWQPLQNPDGSVQQFLAPYWSLVTAFALTSASQIRPVEPALFPDGGYRQQALEIVHLSGQLSDRDKAIATYWADGPASETPPGHWNLHAQWIAQRDAHTLDDDVKLFFALNNALLDASIAAWDCKIAFDYVRPISAVRFLFAGQLIRAWAGPGRATALIDGAHWQPYIPTPPFPEYVSGHSTFSAAAAEVLRQFTGSDAFGASIRIPAGSSFVEPGVAPAEDVVLSWETFSAASDEAGLSRRLGGIHFHDGDMEGRNLGRQVGAQAWSLAQRYFAGSATSAPQLSEQSSARSESHMFR